MKLRPSRRIIGTAVCLALALLTAGAGACGKSSTEPLIPVEPPGIAGRITRVTGQDNFRGTILVESDPTSTGTGPKALTTVTGATLIVRTTGDEGDFRSLNTGQWVRVWFAGPVSESYPVQGKARAIAIDSLASSPNPG